LINIIDFLLFVTSLTARGVAYSTERTVSGGFSGDRVHDHYHYH